MINRVSFNPLTSGTARVPSSEGVSWKKPLFQSADQRNGTRASASGFLSEPVSVSIR